MRSRYTGLYLTVFRVVDHIGGSFNPNRTGGGRIPPPPLRFFSNNFFSINAMNLKLGEFSYKSNLHVLAKF